MSFPAWDTFNSICNDGAYVRIAGETIKIVDHEFCSQAMDATAKATRETCTAIQDLMLNEGIVVDEIILLNAFKTKIDRDPYNTQFDSGTRLQVVRQAGGRVVAILHAWGEIKENK